MKKEVKEALDRIARTEDGGILYDHLHEVLCAVTFVHDEGALRHHEGRRSFASDLMGPMAEGIDAGGRRTVPRRNADDDQPKRRESIRDWLKRQPADQWPDIPDGAAGTNPADKPAGSDAS